VSFFEAVVVSFSAVEEEDDNSRSAMTCSALPGRSRPTAMTVHSSDSARRRAHACPIPDVAPTTTAVFRVLLVVFVVAVAALLVKEVC